jgi:hypothetical protein
MLRQGRIDVKRSTVVELVGTKTVRFADGTELEADLLIWATGWKSSLLPLTSEKKKDLVQLAETYVLNQCPSLQQKLPSKVCPSFPLYRRLVPVDYVYDHSIAYVGMLQSPRTGVIAEVQAVWCAIYLMKKLEINDNVEWEVAVTDVWLRKRYTVVKRHSNYTHDFIRYADLLLKDLELNSMRKKRKWWKEIFEPYMARDYKGIIAEWHAIHKHS